MYLAILLGVCVGKAVASGSGHSKVVNATIAIVIAALGMVVSYYFIDRHILVNELGAEASIPLWESFSFAKELIKAGFKAEQSQYVLTVIAVVLAGGRAFTGTRSKPDVADRCVLVHPAPTASNRQLRIRVPRGSSTGSSCSAAGRILPMISISKPSVPAAANAAGTYPHASDTPE